ncbi:hypothetical protein N431DRAFT_429735 [Stipitochalara longipes BDJ]|nr:hypothetical protein N431DRAFT_429735 [Stipitochalara longipes BDJ]
MTIPWPESLEAIASFLTFYPQIHLGAPQTRPERRMSRSSFFSRSSRDNSPLLPQHNDSVSLDELSPREAGSRRASPSPPPSFYRAQNELNSLSLSPSPSRTKARRIQFAAPPPPIASSVTFPPTHYEARDGTKKGPESSFLGRSSSPRLQRGSGAIDPLLALERTEKAIQNDLQLLLDAQSTGLLQGFGGDAGGGASSDAGSSTPTTRSLHRSSSRGKSGGIVPVRQPKRRTVGLRGARRGLLRDMGDLIAVKREEEAVLIGEIGRRNEALGRVEVYEQKIEGAKNQLSEYSGLGRSTSREVDGDGEEGREIAELRTEERAVENEIREMEDRLAQMKARKRWLADRINESVNKREARLSSYRGALREAELEVKEFLKRPPIYASIVMGDDEGFTTLPPGRRTLDMAKEWWNKEITKLQLRKQEVEREKSALEEGAMLWEESVGIVTEFEEDLRRQMAINEVHGVEKLRDQVVRMGGVITKLGQTLSIAEERGWNLLIAAVGAELEAFKEGEAILRGVLGQYKNENENESEHHEDGSTNGVERSESLEREESQESEDDGPNLAELLVDRRDPDDTP